VSEGWKVVDHGGEEGDVAAVCRLAKGRGRSNLPTLTIYQCKKILMCGDIKVGADLV